MNKRAVITNAYYRYVAFAEIQIVVPNYIQAVVSDYLHPRVVMAAGPMPRRLSEDPVAGFLRGGK